MSKINNDIEEYLLDSTLFKKGEIGIENIQELKKLIEKLPTKERQQEINRIAQLFINYLTCFNEDDIDHKDLPNLLVEITKIISVAIEEDEIKKDSSSAFVVFLFKLNQSQYQDKMIKDCWLFSDIIEDVKWVFNVKKSSNEDAEWLFPVHELISEIVQDFTYSSDNLINLVVALQLFSDISTLLKIKFEKDVKKSLKEISKKYNIGILTCLTEGGKILDDVQMDYEQNKTIIVKSDLEIIIRNQSKNYFDGYPDIKCEVDNDGTEKAYYIVVKIEKNWEFINFSKVMERGNNNCKIKMFQKMLAEKSFNILMKDAIIIDNTDGSFIRLLNPFGKSDRYIVFNSCKDEDNNFKGFFNLLLEKNAIQDIRNSFFLGSQTVENIDIVTFDFVMIFYKQMINELVEYDIFTGTLNLSAQSLADYAQNIIIKNYFEFICNQKKDILYKVMEKYYDFISMYYNIGKVKTKINDVNGLIMPFDYPKPIEGTFNNFCQFFIKDYEVWNESTKVDIVSIEVNEIGFVTIKDKDNSSYKDFEIFTIDSKPFVPTTTMSNKFSVIDNESKKIFWDKELHDLLKIVNFIYGGINSSFIKYENLGKINKRITDIVTIINRIGITPPNYDYFKISKEKSTTLIIFKILWHFVTYSIIDEKINDFYKLIFDKHHTKSILNQESFYDGFEKIACLFKESKNLLIAKEDISNDSTLCRMHNIWVENQHSGETSKIAGIFSSDDIRRNLALDGVKNVITHRGEKIEKIIFITDNMMRGDSIDTLLQYHLHGNNGKTKKYLKLDGNCNVKKIMELNEDVCIEIFALYHYKDVPFKHKDKYPKIHISGENPISLQYVSDEETVQLVKSLYEYETEKDICCMFRYNNMPAKTVFPKVTTETDRLIGLFNRKN